MRKSIKRIISLITSAALMSSNASISVFAEAIDFEGFDIKPVSEGVAAYKNTVGHAPLSFNNDMFSAPVMNLIMPADLNFEDEYDGEYITTKTINSIDELVDLSHQHPASYQNAHIIFAVTASNIDTEDFYGLGSEEYPFNGEITVSGVSKVNLILYRALFNCIYDSAKISSCSFDIIRGTDGVESALFAETVKHNGDNNGTWNVIISKGTDGQTGVATNYSFGGVIGKADPESEIILNVTNYTDSNISKNGDAGFFCSEMMDKSKITVTYSEETGNYSVSSENGSAGALVGKMNNGSELILKSDFTYTGNVTGVNAGGMVGYIENGTVKFNGNITVSGAVLTASAGNAGGLAGTMICSADTEFDLSNFDTDSISVCGTDTGGIFGFADNQSVEGDSLTITSLDNSSVSSFCLSDASSVNYGGIIGRYSSSVLKDSLSITRINSYVSFSGDKVITNYGGVIGKMTGSAGSYTEITDVEVYSDSKAKCSNFGGILADSDSSGHFNDFGNVKVSGGYSSATKAGGLIGFLESGVLRLSGTTDMTDSVVIPANDTGQLVGNRGYALIYALGSGSDDYWTFKRCHSVRADDVGNWGEIVRLVNGSDLESSGIITFDTDLHKITVSHVVNKSNENTAVINSLDDFIKLVLNMQLNISSNKPVLSFAISNYGMTSGKTLSLNTDIDLAGTGITGMLRDDGTIDCKITINGNEHTVKLASGEAYGMRGEEYITDNSEEGNGKLYRHDHIGLISKSNNSTVSSLNIGGSIHAGPDKNAAIYIGGCIGKNESGKVILNNVYAEEKIYIDSTVTNTSALYYTGGLIGYVAKADSLDVLNSGFSSESVISNKDSVRCYSGGIIGGADTLTICNITDTSLSGKIYVGSPELSVANGMAGGLISFIKNLDNNNITRTLNLNNISVDGLEMKIYSSEESGGILGYKWFNSKVFFKTDSDHGVDVNKCDIFTSAKSFGGLVYLATGYWQVNNIKFTAANLNFSNADDFGMLVNKAYLSESSGALYIELTDTESYNIGNSRKVKLICSNLNSFDEIAAFTILNKDTNNNGDNGIVSIPAVDKNNNRMVIMDGSSCNTYANQTEISVKNPNTRYYYNLDWIRNKNKDTLNDSEKFLLWSVSKYSCANISSYFTVNNYNSISGNIDLKGYSYYPIDVPALSGGKDNDTVINNAHFSFYNKEINTAETDDKKDSITRTTDSSTQHYMMHFGIFKNHINPSLGGYDTLSIKGNNSISGSIGYDSNYSGALICGVSEGKYDISVPGYTSVSFAEDGVTIIKDLYLYRYSVGYAPLLINRIGSYSNCVFSGIKTASDMSIYYMDNQRYAAGSLIGSIGSDNSSSIVVVFNRMALDSRYSDTDLSDEVIYELNRTYSTSSCIFNNAVLMEKFVTNDLTGSICSYNFLYDEDWGNDEPRNVTYGYEISESFENYGEQLNYFKDGNHWTSPVDKNASSGYDFSDFMPYINMSPATGIYGNYHELKVNIFYGDLNEGCGTYGDPYIIKDYKQISLISRIIDSGAIPSGSKVNYNSDPNEFCCSSSYSEGHKLSDSNTDIGNYLRKAYYVIDNDQHYIDIPGTFKGLGDKDDTTINTFMGVIIGRNGMKLKMHGSCPFIKISAGSVVKDIEIEYINDIIIKQENSVSSKNELTFKPGCEWGTVTFLSSGKGGTYFGGVIGQIIGGDNILDNVNVKFDGKVSIGTGKYDHLIPVGGYVGVVRNGGLIFRNMEKCSRLENKICDKIDKPEYFYVNPILGRVLDAYAVYMDKYENKPNVKPKINNGNKNYVISSLTDPFKYNITNKISVKANDDATYVVAGTHDGTSKGWSRVSIPDSESLFIFSLLISSGATAMEPKKENDPTQDSGANFGTDWIGDNLWYSEGTSYAIGRTHLAQYTDVGKIVDSSNEDFITSCEDMNNTNRVIGDTNDKYIIPFLVRYYTEKMNDDTFYNSSVPSVTVSWPARLLTGSSMRYSVEMTCESQDIYLPDGFRGINALFGSSYSTNYDRICIATFGFDGNQNHFHINHNVSLYEDDNYPLLSIDKTYVVNGKKVVMKSKTGVGFFNRIMCNSNANVADTSGTKMYNKKPWEYKFDDPENPKQKYAICDMSLSGKVSLNVFNFNNNKRNMNYSDTRAGGLVGSTETGNGNNDRHLYFDSINLSDLSVSGGLYTGGLIGFAGDSKLYNLYIKNVSADKLSVRGGSYVGGLAGRINTCTNNILIDGSDDNGNIAEFDINQLVSESGTTYTGGLIGYIIRPAIIKNMKVVNSTNSFNISSGLYAGGLVGGFGNETNNTNFILEIDNCMVDNIKMAVNHAASDTIIGGIIGKSGTTNAIRQCSVKIRNSIVSNCVINNGLSETNANNSYTSCIVGYIINGNYYLNNIRVSDNTSAILVKSGVDKSLRAGVIAGFASTSNNLDINVYGNNILSENNSFSYTNPLKNNKSYIADWIWQADANKVKLYSVSKQGEYLTGIDIGTLPDDKQSIIIYSDYSGKTENKTPFDTSETGYSPYVNINPKTNISNLNLTGDGAAAYGERLYSSDIMHDSIVNSTDNKKKYVSTNIRTYSEMFYSNGGQYKNNYTTYQNVEKDTDSDKKISGIDFPVILIDTNDSQQITDMINTYVSVLTNEDQLGQGKQIYSNIGVTTYRWNDNGGGFTALPEKENSLVYRNDTIYMSIGKYDNERKQFTLLDVQYNDPSGNDGVVYHLYIPVMVKRLLQFTFDSKIRSGTDYNYADYLSSNRFVIENHGAAVTSVITYSYLRSAAEWQEAINSGEDIFWNFDKEINLVSEDERSSLPLNSRLILTDKARTEMKYKMPGKNDNDNTFWLITSQETFEKTGAVNGNQNLFDLSKMNSITGSGNFSELTLAELLLNQADVQTKKDSEGNLVISESVTDATAIAVYTENGTRSVVLLRPYSSETDEEDIQRYSVTVKSGDVNFMLSEVYYLTVQDSEENEGFVKNFVSFRSNSLKNPDGKAGLPTHKISGNDDVCSYVLGNFFDQTVSVSTNNANEIINSDDLSTVDSTYTSTISFKDQENKQLFVSYSDKLDLYQKFDISLKKVSDKGNISQEDIFGRTLISSEYRITQFGGENTSEMIGSISSEKATFQVPETVRSYSLVYPGSIKEYLNREDVMKISVEAMVDFSYADEQLIMDQFPARTGSEYREGILYCGRSVLAYNREDLGHSTICSDLQEDKVDIHYYRSSSVGVRFTYNAYGDANNPLGVYSQLGKNPSDTNEEYNIKGAGVYNPSILGEEINNAEKIKVSLKLYQKDNDGVYTEIQNSQISDYIKNTDITFNGVVQRFDSTNGYSYEFDLPERPGDLDEFPLISTSFDVNSGSEFENKGLMYSNYKVDISVELYYPDETPVPNSSASDYIIFTNARIYNKLINAG